MKAFCYGNWKLNLPHQSFFEFQENWEEVGENVEVGVFAQATHLQLLKEKLNSKIRVGSQDISSYESGAFTGEISVQALKDLKVERTLVGHSERRTYHGETNLDCKEKITLAKKYDISPIYCVGETLENRENGETSEVLKTQIQEALDEFKGEIIIAYEPVWAIGTGKVATPKDIEGALKIIKEALPSEVSAHLLYGGSAKPSNIDEIMSVDLVNGALIGGASLKPQDLLSMAMCMKKYVQ